MTRHPYFPDSPYAILESGVCWLPADKALRETNLAIFDNDTMTLVDVTVGGKS